MSDPQHGQQRRIKSDSPPQTDHVEEPVPSLLPLDPAGTPEAVAEPKLAHEAAAVPEAPIPAWRVVLTRHAAISIGAVFGAIARFQVSDWVAPFWGTAFPWGTFLVNVTGGLLLGFYLTLETERFVARPTTTLLIATGFLGSYTTFSTFSQEALALVRDGSLAPALTYMAGSLALGVAAVAAGIMVVRLTLKRA